MIPEPVTRPAYLAESPIWDDASQTLLWVDIMAGDVHRFEIELQPTSYVVPAGHRIRFAVQGAAIDPSLDLAFQGPGLGLHPFTVTVHTGPGHASYAEIPFIGDDPGL